MALRTRTLSEAVSIAATLFSSVFLCCCGVSAPERLEVTGLGPSPRTLRADLGTGTYSQELANTSFILSDIPLERLEQGGDLNGYLLHVNLLWIPKAGKTAIDPESTNASLRLLIFSGAEIGIYGGGGFAWPRGEPGDTELGLDVVGSSLSLLASTKGFTDLLSPAQLTGRLTSRFDEVHSRRMRRTASQVVSNALRAVEWVGPGTDMLKRETDDGLFLAAQRRPHDGRSPEVSP